MYAVQLQYLQLQYFKGIVVLLLRFLSCRRRRRHRIVVS